jgi:membrane fusion protein (multidrug efflux system)
VSGYLKKIYVDEGDTVRKGQLLAEIDAPDIVQEYRKAKADADLKEVTLKRNTELLKEQVISQQEFDTLQADTEEAQAKLQNAAANISYTRITAPFAGSIARRFKYPGDLITSGTKGGETPIFLIVNEDALRVAINVPQSELSSIQLGHVADVHVDAAPGQVFEGKVARLDALMDEATKTQRVLIELKGDPRIHAGMFASVTLHTESRDHALTLPKEAIVEHEGRSYAYVFRSGQAHRSPVTLGMSDGSSVEIVQGVSPDDKVLLTGGVALADGTEVKLAEEPVKAVASKGPTPAQDGKKVSENENPGR